MSEDVRSYLKTTAIIVSLAVVVGAAGGLVLLLAPPGSVVLGTFVAAATALLLLLLLAAGAGLVVAQRARRSAAGLDDLYVALNRSRSESAFAARTPRLPLRGLRRALGAPRLLVGDSVKIKTLGEIQATLDASGCIDSLPFMVEMERFCGKRAKVFRVVDKVYDYGGKKDLRRLRDTVLLHGLRCDGAAHGGCQAECYLFWKTAWLEPIANAPAEVTPTGPGRPGDVRDEPGTIYRCQYTQIVASSQPMKSWGVPQYLRPLLSGNITVRAFLTTIATILFNAVQKIRGGIGYPFMQPRGTSDSPNVELGLGVGDTVQVKSAAEIARTLNKRGRNKGLWFDRDMLKHAGKRYVVRARVERIIDDVNGKMLRMNSPCILLDGVDGSGEYLRFSAQHDYVFWREAWLTRVDSTSAPDRPTPKV